MFCEHILLNINNFIQHQLYTTPLYDHNRSRQKQDHSIIMYKHRQNISNVQAIKYQTSPSQAQECFLTNYSFGLTLVLPLSRSDLLRYLIIELSSLPDSIQSRGKPCCLKSSSKLPNTSPNSLGSFQHPFPEIHHRFPWCMFSLVKISKINPTCSPQVCVPNEGWLKGTGKAHLRTAVNSLPLYCSIKHLQNNRRDMWISVVHLCYIYTCIAVKHIIVSKKIIDFDIFLSSFTTMNNCWDDECAQRCFIL